MTKNIFKTLIESGIVGEKNDKFFIALSAYGNHEILCFENKQCVIEYLRYLKEFHPEAKYLFGIK